MGKGICNHCNGVLNKYIISRKDHTLSFPDASNECKSIWNTTLASLHSDDDLAEANLLCEKTGTLTLRIHCCTLSSYHLSI